MGTIDELQSALVKADAAGDAAGAKILADHIRSMNAVSVDQPLSQPQEKSFVSNVLGGAGNALYGAAKGAADLVQAPAQLLLNTANSVSQSIDPESAPSQYLGTKAQQFNEYLTNQENQYQQETPDSISAGIGRFASNAVPFALTGGGSAASASAGVAQKSLQLAKLLGKSAGLTAVTQPLTNVDNEDFLQQKATQAGLGAAGGVLGAGAGKVLGGVISPAISKHAKAALDEGITPTIGQLYGGKAAKLENVATSLPFIGNLIKDAQRSTTMDVNRAVYNRVLNPIGKKADNLKIGSEGVAEVKGIIGDAYDALLPKLQFKGDKEFGENLNTIVKMVNTGILPQKEATQFNAILKNNILYKMTPQGNMSGHTLKEIENDIGQKARGFAGSSDPNQRQLGSALNEVMSSIRKNLSRSNPEYAKELSDINRGYANYTILRSAAKSPATENGVFTPAQLARAVYAQDKSVGKGASATGKALMQDLAQTSKTIAPTFPNSGTADRLSIPALIGSAAYNPVGTMGGLAVGALGAIPYTQSGKKLAAALLARRPAGAQEFAQAVKNTAVPLGAILAGDAYPMFNGGR